MTEARRVQLGLALVPALVAANEPPVMVLLVIDDGSGPVQVPLTLAEFDGVADTLAAQRRGAEREGITLADAVRRQVAAVQPATPSDMLALARAKGRY